MSHKNLLDQVNRIGVGMFGSLGATGKGHGTDKAVIGGLSGLNPETVDSAELLQLVQTVTTSKRISAGGVADIDFDTAKDLTFSGKVIGQHSNAMRFESFDIDGKLLLSGDYYSVGGGFVVNADAAGEDRIVLDETPIPFTTGKRLLELCDEHGLSISTLMLRNELVWRKETEVRQQLLEIWSVMQACVERGCREKGILSGGLKVRRRAAPLFRKLQSDSTSDLLLSIMDWVNLWALAVNEENAAGGRVVTAPTNGAAGIIPAVLHYYHQFCAGADDEGNVRFFLTAAAIGTLFRINASI